MIFCVVKSRILIPSQFIWLQMTENNNLCITKSFCVKFVSKEVSVYYTIYIFITIFVMDLLVHSVQFKLRILQHAGLRTENLILL